MNQRLLCVGNYSDDIRSLVAVAEQAQQQLSLEPIFLIHSTGRMRSEAKAIIQAKGLTIIDQPLVAAEGRNIRNPYKRFKVRQAANIRLAHRLLAQINPAVILATAGLSLLEEATRSGIPTLLLQVALWPPMPIVKAMQVAETKYHDSQLPIARLFKRKIARLLERLAGFRNRGPFWNAHTTKMAVQGSYYKRILLEGGIAEQQVVVTGNPMCDWLYEARLQKHDPKPDLYAWLNLPSGSEYFLHCREHHARLSAIPDQMKKNGQIQIIKSLRMVNPDIPIVVKLHPKEGAEEERFVRSIDDRVIVAKNDIPLFSLIAESEVTISTVSTTLIWAAGLDTPSISAFFWRGADWLEGFIDCSGIDRVFSPEQLTQTVRQYLNNSTYSQAWRAKRETYAKDQMVLDGGSIERLVALINELISRGNGGG